MEDSGKVALYSANREGFTAYDLAPGHWRDRAPGLSAMLRVKNEQLSIAWCLQSIYTIFDEIVVALQNSTDETEQIVRDLRLPNVRLLHYPFDSHPNGPGHDSYPADSVYSRSYFYNWTLAQTTRQWACKWDGDMVAMDDFAADLRRAMTEADIVRFHGVNLAGAHLDRYAVRKFTASEPRLFRVTESTFYYPGKTCEVFTYPKAAELFASRPRTKALEKPAFVHLKWIKPEKLITQAWPADWINHRHFRELIKRGEPDEPYQGPLPGPIRQNLR